MASEGPSTCTVTAVEIDPEFEYDRLKPGGIVLPTVITVVCNNLKPERRVVEIAGDALPFGLLESVSVTGGVGEAPLPAHRLHFRKTTGQVVSDKVDAPGTRICAVSGPLCLAQDALEDDLRTVYEKSGHDFRFRMLAALPIVGLAIEFYGPPPPTVVFRFHGANLVGSEEDVAHVRSRKLSVLQLPPIRHADRLRSAAAVLKAKEATMAS